MFVLKGNFTIDFFDQLDPGERPRLASVEPTYSGEEQTDPGLATSLATLSATGVVMYLMPLSTTY